MDDYDWNDLTFFQTSSVSGFDEIVEELGRQAAEGLNILPSPEDILNAFKYTPFLSTKVVILGQDPYPNRDHAMGLAFSVPKGVKPFPASLRNIFQELQDDLGCPKPKHGNLMPWAHQGVLLLNTSLTVVEGSIGSHSKLGWHALVNQALSSLSRHRKHLVYILWGKNAQAKALYINHKQNLVLRAAHPSPMSANRGGFFGTKPFSKTNEYLERHGIEPINWCLD